ncbi:ABC transporter permease [Pararobbsia alpina]|uniref:Dipeptide transport system permease protein DppB n=1 Tax=Pararobbsia alpina TaxID=621374 RepID=A0A6S7BJ97_9BURK|nr:ABC transporter permease [Pararobbsia alpina]CAB3800898.1 Dipeptide transport system permease protein DppB [Pararobbsia alpina]
MIRFLLRRLGAAIVLILVLSAIIFVLRSISTGDPVRAYLGANASAASIAAERQALGLNDPLPVRYVHFVGGLVHGDLGMSLRTRRPVVADLRDFLPATVELVTVSFVIALVLGTLFAVSGALRWRGSALFRGSLLLLATAPPFLLALGGIVLFYAQLGWLPAAGRGAEANGPTGFLLVDTLTTGNFAQWASAAQHLLLPALVLAIAPAISIGRIFRASLELTLRADFVRTAESKGLTSLAVLTRHVIRNSIGPALSMAGLQLGFMFAGVVVVEQIFSWPGIGNYLASSLPVSDFPAIAGITLVLGTIYIAANVVVDVLQVLADPRLNA